MEPFEPLDPANLADLKPFLENDGMVCDTGKLAEFLAADGAHGFLYRVDGVAVGFAYGCRLLRPAAARELYLHTMDILPAHQHKGYGTRFLQSMLRFAEENGFCNLFLCSSQSLKNTCKIYERCGGGRACTDEVVYNYPLG